MSVFQADVMVMGRGSARYLFLLRMACSTAGRTGNHLGSMVGRAYIPGCRREPQRCGHEYFEYGLNTMKAQYHEFEYL